MSPPKQIAKSKIRKDARDKVSGISQYAADIQLPESFHGALLRSPHHHARILRLDLQEAKKSPGVAAVLTADDVPGEKVFGAIIPDRPVLASDVVRHQGEAIALVIARTKRQARAALNNICVEYQPLPAVHDPRAALEETAPRIHPDGNLLLEYDQGRGDIEAGFQSSDLILEETFHLPRIYPGYLEPEASLAQWQQEGSLRVWVSSQKPFEDQKAIARALDLPLEKIQVKSAEIGGAFGGKEDSSLPILAALAAYHLRGTVKLVNSREESILAHPKRHPMEVQYKIGASRDGRLQAIEVNGLMDTGAYASYGPAVGGVFTEIASGAYNIPHTRVRNQIVYTNSPFSGAMRGFGAPQAIFAVECILDQLADALEMDPVALRRKNILHKGDRTPIGVLLEEEPSLGACLDEVERAVQALESVPAAPGKQTGVGFALLIQAMGLGHGLPDHTTTRIQWLPEGGVSLDIGTPDMGQGTLTIGAQIAAERLAIDYDQVQVTALDTASSPDGGVTCASRMTYMVGNSILKSAEAAVEALLDQAAALLEVPRGKISYQQGFIHLEGKEQRPIPAAEIAAKAAAHQQEILGEETYSFPYPPEITPQDLPIGMPHIRFGFGAHVARVEVDPAFGTVEVQEIHAIHDVGKALNPAGVEGQIEGGVVMGVGYSLLEEVKLKGSGNWTDNLTEYLLPTAADAPKIKSIILEYPEPTGPYGARGMAEMSMSPVAPAVVNALKNATGKTLTRIPVRPEDLLESEEAAPAAQ